MGGVTATSSPGSIDPAAVPVRPAATVMIIRDAEDYAAGDYVVGFIIEDLDGNQFPVYTRITVQ